MNVAFITLSQIQEIESRGIYKDLIREFRNQGHKVYIITPYERRLHLNTNFREIDEVHILGVKTLNIQQTNIVEKGLSTVLLEYLLKKAVKRYLKNIDFRLIIYSTPPITFTNVVKLLKAMNPRAISYLLLKDIFPQNAVDLGIFSKKSLFYKFFRKKEKDLYKCSDFIGCMSPANVKFLLNHNSEISTSKVEITPNTITLLPEQNIDKNAIRAKYGLPLDKPIFIYGGNLGKPQGIDYVIKSLMDNLNRTDCHFVIVGGGTEVPKLQSWYNWAKPNNISLFESLNKFDYDLLVKSCDIGLIFLDYRFTIPNFPSRILSYLENRMPVIAATDVNTDIGTIAVENNFGMYCQSLNPNDFTNLVNKFVNDPSLIKSMGNSGYNFLKKNYQTKHSYQTIMSHLS